MYLEWTAVFRQEAAYQQAIGSAQGGLCRLGFAGSPQDSADFLQTLEFGQVATENSQVTAEIHPAVVSLQGLKSAV